MERHTEHPVGLGLGPPHDRRRPTRALQRTCSSLTLGSRPLNARVVG
jgi:hypothetical protein